MTAVVAGTTAGSSPLTRGKQTPRTGLSEGRGLIPAHAGKTRASRPGAAGFSAHPRSRGENQVGCQRLKQVCGSSPLTRGKPYARHSGTVGHRLIPAHAGKTARLVLRGRRVWAHPRSRGENPLWLFYRENTAGSSPLTRGKPHGLAELKYIARLIPAHAGKTSTRKRASNPDSGSSPLTRGKQAIPPPVVPRVGLIPAHAGKTP